VWDGGPVAPGAARRAQPGPMALLLQQQRRRSGGQRLSESDVTNASIRCRTSGGLLMNK
jgi:hypothetical protein